MSSTVHAWFGLWLTLTPPIGAPVVASRGSSPLEGVARETTLEVELVDRRALPVARLLPGAAGVEVDLAIDDAAAAGLLDALPDDLHGTLRPVEGAIRLQIVHPSRPLRARASSRGRTYRLVIGPESEDTRLHRLAAIVARPLPEPAELGAYLELWQEAELATRSGELRLARRLWEKLLSARKLDDLAALRVAELFLMSGHVDEAVAQLRSVSRRYPRSTGAALARLDLLHVEALTGEGTPTTAQLDLAATSVSDRKFDAYAELRSALVFVELGEPGLAALRIPDAALLPASWGDTAVEERQAILEAAVATPGLRDDPLATAVAWEAWSEALAEHPRRDAIVEAVTAAQLRLGLYERAVPLLRERLRARPTHANEFEILAALASAFAATKDVTRLAEVVAFAVAEHPKAPGVVALASALADHERESAGLPAARARLAQFRDTVTDATLRPALWAAEADLVTIYGSVADKAQFLARYAAVGFDEPARREPELALALARQARCKSAIPLLRKWIGRTQDPQARDRLAYYLARCELDLGREDDGEKILTLLARGGTRYSRIARALVQERSLQEVLDELQHGAPKATGNPNGPRL